ncbi:hypothetical protein ACFFWD_38815 [Bradyrhizobium erythrophlei]|uniref:hypothetical protein n=1 Tax=Bradyrhizobium erythrophlei TaxID=1437360 RepID=UPI0035E5289A
MIIPERTAILIVEPESSDFHQQVPVEGHRKRSPQQRRSSAKKRRHQGRSLVEASYRNESLAWMQVAELSFDSFMMRMRTRT